MILSLSKRPAQVGPSINTRTEKHGNDDVPGIDIPVSQIFLDKDELNALLQDVEGHDALYTEARGEQLEPRFQTIQPLVLDDKFTGAKVSLEVTTGGEKTVLHLKPAKIAKIKLEPQVGGLTLMSCTVQGNPQDHTDVLALLNQKCRLSILNAERDEKPVPEPELPLGHEAQGEEAPPTGADLRSDPELSRTGKKIIAAKRKSAKSRAH
jgi:hypothetical protein